jgi:uncharacterized protein
MHYFDSCAILKLLHPESESAGLQDWLRKQGQVTRVTSVLAEVEVARALRTAAPDMHLRVQPMLASFFKWEIDGIVRARAAAYAQPHLRTLDAIHLATAEEMRGELTAFLTYDKRLAAAAEAIGLPVECPGL